VVLAEKGELTSGTTFHSAGLVTQVRTSPADSALMRASVALYRRIATECGEASGWRVAGEPSRAS
jgi:4-methylaminobutanoate oxidase (formaldehyde-forming)